LTGEHCAFLGFPAANADFLLREGDFNAGLLELLEYGEVKYRLLLTTLSGW
jgi:hypothetical protein